MSKGERAPGHQPFNVQAQHSKKRNGKFQRDTKAYDERRGKLAAISAAASQGRSFSHLQTGGGSQ